MLTDSQRKTLEFIRHFVASNGYAPKLQEIADGIGIQSRGVAHRYVQALINAGYLENLEQGVFNVEGIYYRRRAQLELEWDILNNGYLDNRHEIRELENEKQTDLKHRISKYLDR